MPELLEDLDDLILDPNQIQEPKRVYELKERTNLFAIDICKYAVGLPQGGIGRVFSNQLMRAATSVGANYRAASLAQSRASFIAKLSIALEEADECAYWIDIITSTGLDNSAEAFNLKAEAEELTAILAASRKSARQNR